MLDAITVATWLIKNADKVAIDTPNQVFQLKTTVYVNEHDAIIIKAEPLPLTRTI